MPKFKVTITTVFTKVVEIEAPTADDAKLIASDVEDGTDTTDFDTSYEAEEI